MRNGDMFACLAHLTFAELGTLTATPTSMSIFQLLPMLFQKKQVEKVKIIPCVWSACIAKVWYGIGTEKRQEWHAITGLNFQGQRQNLGGGGGSTTLYVCVRLYIHIENSNIFGKGVQPVNYLASPVLMAYHDWAKLVVVAAEQM